MRYSSKHYLTLQQLVTFYLHTTLLPVLHCIICVYIHVCINIGIIHHKIIKIWGNFPVNS
jgi:hypothetical protein